MLIVSSKEQNIIQITNMFQERGRWRKGKKKIREIRKRFGERKGKEQKERLMQAVDSMRSERERERDRDYEYFSFAASSQTNKPIVKTQPGN